MCGTVFDDCLGDRQDVPLVECGVESGPAVTGRAEQHLLLGDRGIGNQAVVGGYKVGQIHQVLRLRGLARPFVRHLRASAVVCLLPTPIPPRFDTARGCSGPW